MFGGKAREYPHLVTYLHYASQDKPFEWTASPNLTAAGLGALGLLGGSVAFHQPILSVLAMAALVPITALTLRKSQPVPTPEEVRRGEAREVAKIMRQCLDLRRLHRDLDEGSLLLIEECARYWGRVKSVFESGFWGQADLPPAYLAARNQGLRAADEAMQDVLLLFRPSLPSDVKSRPAIDYVEEALEKVVFGGQTSVGHLSTAFGPARQIADRLQAIALEAEQIAGDAGRERLSGENAAGSSLETTLGELRAIRQAEDELRQNLRG